MRKIILMMSISLDGFIEGPNRELDVHPIAIGRGKPLFPRSDITISLRLIETRTFGNGVVLLRYARRS